MKHKYQKLCLSKKTQTKLWCRIHLTWGRLKTCSKDSAAEWNDSEWKDQKIELAVPEDKIEKEIT